MRAMTRCTKVCGRLFQAKRFCWKNLFQCVFGRWVHLWQNAHIERLKIKHSEETPDKRRGFGCCLVKNIVTIIRKAVTKRAEGGVRAACVRKCSGNASEIIWNCTKRCAARRCCGVGKTPFAVPTKRWKTEYRPKNTSRAGAKEASAACVFWKQTRERQRQNVIDANKKKFIGKNNKFYLFGNRGNVTIRRKNSKKLEMQIFSSQ